MEFENYKEERISELVVRLEEKNSQPALFIGSGLSLRYLGAPSWLNLLDKLRELCPSITHPLAYYQQGSDDLAELASRFIEDFREWAWNEGKTHFPDDVFEGGVEADFYLKFMAAKIIEQETSAKIDDLADDLKQEVDSLKDVKPVTIITTNYDTLLERIFPEYQPIIGQDLITGHNFAIGEIHKIHGCVSKAESLVLTTENYDRFFEKQRFVTAKLMTLFFEHVVVVFGYNAGDPNIAAVLSDLDLAYGQPGETLKNIFLVEYVQDVEKLGSYQTTRLIKVSENRSVQVNLIQADSFQWIYDALSYKNFAPRVPTSILRTILSRTHELLRSDDAVDIEEASFEFLENRLESGESFAKVLGIAKMSTPAQFSAEYRYILTEVGVALGFNGWHGANAILDRIKRDTGIDIKASDNSYHAKVRSGKSKIDKYSQKTVDLLQLIMGLPDNGKIDSNWIDL